MPVKKIQLNYKASNIAKAEREYNQSFFDAMSNGFQKPSVSVLEFLFVAGGATEEEFDEAFTEGVDSLMLTIAEGINDAGFLGTKMDLGQLKKDMEKAKAQAQSSTTSENTGEANKA